MIEKILKRLEAEARTSADAKTEAIISMQGASANFYSGEVSSYDKAKKIVQEVAKDGGACIACSDCQHKECEHHGKV